MAILLFIVFGFIAGLLARALMPGNQSMGFLMTSLLGIVGSFVGGFVVSLISHHRITDLHTTGIIGSVLGAILVLAIAGAATRR